MFNFRFLHDLKGMVKNRAKVEGSICEAYLVQESSYFSSYYFEPDIQSKRTRSRRNEVGVWNDQSSHTLSIFNQSGRPTGKCSSRWLSDAELKAASHLVLINCDEVVPFLG